MGPVTSVDPSGIPSGACQDCLNVRFEDGVLRNRYGYATVRPSQGTGTIARGFGYVSGYSSSYSPVQEFIGFEKPSGGSVHPYSFSTTNYARTEIKNGASSVNLYDDNWYVSAFDDTAFFFCPTSSSTQLYSHTIGTSTSLTAISAIAAPTARPGWAPKANDQIDLSGLDPSATGANVEVNMTGKASHTNSSLGGTSNVQVRHTTGKGAASIEIIFSKTTAGNRDWYWNDAFNLTIYEQNTSKCAVIPSSIAVQLSNSDGTAVVIQGTVLAYRDNAGYLNVRVWWNRGKTRSDWGNGSGTGKTALLKISYELSLNSGVSNSLDTEVNFLFQQLGWTEMLPVNETYQRNGVLKVAYTWYDSTTGFESDLSPILEIPYNQLYLPTGDLNAGSFLVGQRKKFTFAATGSADKTRIYVMDATGVWRRVAEVNDTASPYDSYYTPYDDLLALTAYSPRAFETTRKICGAVPFKGWMVWLYTGGKQNVRHSRVGEALAQASAYDDPNSSTYNLAGANFSLSDDFGDEPLNGYQCDDALVITGSKGIYAQYGDRPTNMSPIYKLPGSMGCAGPKASCRWIDDNGKPCVAFIDKNATGVYLAYASIDGTAVVELTSKVRGLLQSFLLSPQALSASSVMLGADEEKRALWIVAGKRAMVLRRYSVINGERQWELYSYPLAFNINALSFTGAHGLKWQLADGTVQEVERVYSTGSYYTADDGAEISGGYWKSRTIHTAYTCLGKVFVVKNSPLETVTVGAESASGESEVVVKAGSDWAMFKPSQQGTDHAVTIYAPKSTSGIVSAEIVVNPCGRKWK